MFSQTSEYALRAVVCLAQHTHRPMTTQQIAEKTQVPAGYLSKVLQQLGRASIVDSQRGVHGGFTLRADPQNVTILDVLRIVDPVPRIAHCPLRIKEHGKELCSLHRRLDDALAQIEESFGRTTLADLLADANLGVPLCQSAADPTHVNGASHRD
jgi:Rrf2 family transcriptional regulator, nitric oxide-sensitive transcriptional repressor